MCLRCQLWAVWLVNYRMSRSLCSLVLCIEKWGRGNGLSQACGSWPTIHLPAHSLFPTGLFLKCFQSWFSLPLCTKPWKCEYGFIPQKKGWELWVLGHSITLLLFTVLIYSFIQQGVGPNSQKQSPENLEKYSCFALFAKFGKEVIF